MNATAEEATTQIREFTKTEASLSSLEVKYSKVPDAKTKDGYGACVEAIRELRPLRTGLDKMRLSLNADDQSRIKMRNTEAKRITARLSALEDPIKAAKQAIDDRIEREAEQARQKEMARIEGITRLIAEVQKMSQVLPQEDAIHIQTVIDSVASIDLGTFAEYEDQARAACAETMIVLHKAIKTRKEFEHQQAEQARIAKEQAEKQAELDAQAEKQRQAGAEARDKLDAEKAAVRKAEQAVADEKRAAEQAKLDEQRREQEKKDAEIKAEQDRLAAQKLAAEQAEQERLAEEQRQKDAEAEAQRLEASRPARDKLRTWAELVASINAPILNDEDLDALGSHYEISIRQLGNSLAAEIDCMGER